MLQCNLGRAHWVCGMKLKVSTIKGQEHFGDGERRGREDREKEGREVQDSLARVLEAEENKKKKHREVSGNIRKEASFQTWVGGKESLLGTPDSVHTREHEAFQSVGLTLSYIRFSSRGTTGKMVGRRAFMSSERRRMSPWKKPTRPPWQ